MEDKKKKEETGIESVIQEATGEGRDKQGRWIKGVSGNPEGAIPWTEEEKLAKKAKKKALEELKETYLNKLVEALPEITPALISKAQTGDVSAIKEVMDRIYGKSQQSVRHSGDKENPISILGGQTNVFSNNSNEKSSQSKEKD